MDLGSPQKFITEIDRVIKELDVLNLNVEGGGTKWEDTENSKKDLISDIIHGEWVDGFLYLLKGAAQMKALLHHAKELSLDMIESKAEQDAPSISIRETKDSRTLKVSEHPNTSCLVQKVVDDAKHELIGHIDTVVRNLDNRRKGRDHNVMVFMELEDQHDLNHINSYHEEIEAAFSYLDCDKEELREVEIVQDANGNGTDNKSILRVRMDSTEAVSSLLANASNLRSYEGPRLYLAKDLSYVERLRLRKLVKDLREKIDQQPEYYWKIIDGEVRNLGRFKQRAYRKQRKSTEISDSESEICDDRTWRYQD